MGEVAKKFGDTSMVFNGEEYISIPLDDFNGATDIQLNIAGFSGEGVYGKEMKNLYEWVLIIVSTACFTVLFDHVLDMAGF